MKLPLYLAALVTVLMGSCKSQEYADLGDGLYAALKTNKGDIVLQLEYEKTPVTVANFVSLAEGNNPHVSENYKDKPFYDGLTFHRVMKDFMIQGGDPLGSGRGNQGYRFRNEINDSLKHDRKGILSMANSGGDKTNGSQFFITHAPTPWLDGRHSVFGEVVVGLEVVDSIAAVEVNPQNNKPLSEVVMEKVIILRKGKAAKNFDALKILEDYFAEEAVLEEKQRQEAAARQEMIMAFAAELLASKEGAESMASGLQYRVIQKGEGPKPKVGQMVMVDYAGWLENGTLFDTSIDSIARAFGKYEELSRLHSGVFEPVPMDYSPDSNLISGFKEAILSMTVGDKWRVYIPPHLGYGAQGGGPIPPNSNIVFDLEITGSRE